MILKHLIRQRIGREGSAETLIKRQKEEEDKFEAEKEFLGNFEKARKVFKPIRKETAPKEVIKSEIEIRRTVEEKKMVEENMKVIKEFMHDIKEELKIIKEWRKEGREQKGRIKEVEDKIERTITGNEVDGDIEDQDKRR